MFLHLTLYLLDVYTKYLRIFLLLVAVILAGNQLPFLFSETINTAQKERGIEND